MFELIIEDYISCAHQLLNYNGPCENLHGHNWKIQIVVSGKDLDKSGLLIDFKDLKKILNEELLKYDHKFLNDAIKENPTSENFAKLLYENLKKKMPNNVKLTKVYIWESNDAGVSYSEE
jgi:6-pyruvoyltetrahydropterin/6-carboxytetrahydropterin synthase